MRNLFVALVVGASVVPAAFAAKGAKPVLTVYTYESLVSEWGPGAEVKSAFEQTCGCELRWVAAEDGAALLTRLKIEGAKTKADIIMGLDNNLMAEARDTNFFLPYQAKWAKTLSLPVEWKDTVFTPFDYGHFAFMMDTEKVKTPPKSLAEFLDGKDWNKSLIVQDPRTSTPGLGMLLWVKSIYGDKSKEALEKLRKKTLTVTKGWSEAYGLFTKGEAPFVLSYVTSEAYHVVEEKSTRYKAVPFSEGHYLQVEVAGILKSSKQQELAKSFMDFLGDPRVQSAMALKNWMMPVIGKVATLPEIFIKLPEPGKSLLIDSGEVAKNRKAWVQEWLSHFRN